VRILIVSDLHYSLPQFDWTLAQAGRYDLLVVAGDLLDISGFVDPGSQIVVVLKYLKRLAAEVPVVVCSGNHDLDATNAAGEKYAGWLSRVRRLGIGVDGDTLEVGDLLVTVCPWWDGPGARQAIGEQLAVASGRRSGRWLWVYHAPPTASPVSWSGTRSYGDPALVDWIGQFRPDYIISGHVHEAPFARDGSWADQLGDTWIFIAGRQIGPTPTTISIDTAVEEAAWFSLEGAESVKLAEPLVRPIPPLTAMPAWMPAR
jgi:Icc-related predicted phosphoesterase